jgi:drug/metabolite transporter (DMT)-like permease
MPIYGFLWACAAGLPWAAAAIVGRISGVPVSLMPILISGGSFIACLPTLFFINRSELEWGAPIKLALLAGILNGIGMAISWQVLIGGAGQGKWELSTVMPIAYTLLFLFIAIGTITFLGEAVTVKRIMGMAIAGVALYLMRG